MITRSMAFAAALLAACGAAHAAVLEVGAGQRYAQPSAAIAAAQNGDTVQIHPGQYYDCAIIRQSNITIEGVGDGAVLTDSTCGGKGILITNGNNITIRNLTLQRARVPDQNGAVIRAQGGNLTVEDTRFINNQMGILAGGNLRPRSVASTAPLSATVFARGAIARRTPFTSVLWPNSMSSRRAFAARGTATIYKHGPR